MLYPTLNQPLIILFVFLAGLFSGTFFDLARILTLLFGKSKIFKHINEFFATILSCLSLFFVNLRWNYGQFRVYVLLVFLTSFALERIFVSFLWTKLLKKWYNSIVQRRKQVGTRKKEEVD